MPGLFIPSRKLAILTLIFILSAGLLEVIPTAPAQAQEAPDIQKAPDIQEAPEIQKAPKIQEIRGTINPGGIDVFRLSGLEKGHTLYVSLQNISGDLDPALSLVSGSVNLPELITAYRSEVQKLVQTAEHPLVELPILNERTFLAWDDDSGAGHNALLKYVVPQDGDYVLGVSGALTAAGRITSGDYRLVLGIDAPEVLGDQVTPNGAVIAVQDDKLLGSPGRVQEYTASLDAKRPKISLELYDFDPGETLSIFIEATSGDLKPILMLTDYGGKPVRVGNLQGRDNRASLDYPFPEGGKAYHLDIYAGDQGEQPSSGEFRLLAGVDSPEVLSGTADANSQQVLRLPIEVQTGLKLQEIVSIDQQNEIATVVGTLKMTWKDPKLSFSPDTCDCSVKEYTDNSFNQFLNDTGGDWPEFTFFNQQGNRWIQDRLVEIQPDGSVTYLERFTTNFQLNFDFSKYPFDREEFYIYVDLLYPEDRYVMTPMEGFSEIDPQHGEDEFILTDFDTSVKSVISSRVFPTSRFTFHFSAPRYKMYYVFRIFVPILLIISVSYVTFFLKDYTRRIEVATGNLLLFIAFSWSLAEDYPRMGYLTFLDAIMAITFVVNTLVVIYNVYLKWLETHDKREMADNIDRVADWVYPIGYVILFGATIAYFFL